MNCNGGWNEGDMDIYNFSSTNLVILIIQEPFRRGSFSLSEKYNCGTFLDQGKNVMMIIWVIIMTMIFIFISVYGNIKTVEQHIRGQPFENIVNFKQLKQSLIMHANKDANKLSLNHC